MRILYRFEGTWPLDPYCIRAELIYFWLRRGVLETVPVKTFCFCICVLLFFLTVGHYSQWRELLPLLFLHLNFQALKGVSWVPFTAPGEANRLPLFHLETDSKLCQIALPLFLTFPFVEAKGLLAGFSDTSCNGTEIFISQPHLHCRFFFPQMASKNLGTENGGRWKHSTIYLFPTDLCAS